MAESIEPGKFQCGEKAYVPHTDKYYEAKILKAEYRGQAGWHYFLHYNGWNKKYDEWVEEAGLVKAEVAEAQGAAAPAGGKARKGAAAAGGGGAAGGGAARGSGAAGGAGTKKSGGAAAAGAAAAVGGLAGAQALTLGPLTTASLGALVPPSGPTIGLDIDFPALIKKYLIEDYEAVVEENKLLPLPRSPTVQELLQRYVAEAKETRPGSADAEEEVAHGLLSYFDKCLLPLLLYRAERPQAEQLLCDGRMPSVVFGAEHLARLLSKLQDVMPLSSLPDDQLAMIAAMVQDVLLWLEQNASTYFLPKDLYVPAPTMIV